jgi:hypothetical protein
MGGVGVLGLTAHECSSSYGVQGGLNQYHEKLRVGSRSRLRLDGCTHSLCSAISRAWPFPGSGSPCQLTMTSQCKKTNIAENRSGARIRSVLRVVELRGSFQTVAALNSCVVAGGSG